MTSDGAGLFALLYRETFFDPILAEILGNVENLDVLKTQGMEFLISRPQIGTHIPGAAATIDDDGLGARQRFNTLAQKIETFRPIPRAEVFGSRDVSLSVKYTKTDMDYKRL